jgi:hypothetical protein
MAGMRLLIIAKKENMSRAYQWITCTLMTIAALILICQLVRGISMMVNHDDRNHDENKELMK